MPSAIARIPTIRSDGRCRYAVFSDFMKSHMMCSMSANPQHIVRDGAAKSLEVVYRPVTELIPDKRNARTHPERQIEQLKAAISTFGFTNPILIDETATLIAGHGRLRAAKDLGLTEVPTITFGGSWRCRATGAAAGGQ